MVVMGGSSVSIVAATCSPRPLARMLFRAVMLGMQVCDVLRDRVEEMAIGPGRVAVMMLPGGHMTQVRRSFIVAASQRSGSTLMCRLQDTGRATRGVFSHGSTRSVPAGLAVLEEGISRHRTVR